MLNKDNNNLVNVTTLTEDEIIELYTYLSGINHKLAYHNWQNIILRRKCLQQELYYLWNITIMKNKNNEALKEYKLKTLVKDYYHVIDFKGQHFLDLYRPYIAKIGLDFKSPEKNAAEESPQSAPAAPGSTAPQTAPQ